MNRLVLSIVAIFVALAGSARAADTNFAQSVDLTPLKTLAVQNQQTIKTMDSYARQTLSAITGHGSIDGQPAVYTVLDMAFRPDVYKNRNLIKIKHLPLREEIAHLKTLPAAEQSRIMHEGTISLATYRGPEITQLVQDIMANDLRKAEAVQELDHAANTLASVLMGRGGFPPVELVAPATARENDTLWHGLAEIQGNVPEVAEFMKTNGMPVPPVLPNYETRSALFKDILTSAAELTTGWQDQNASQVNESAQRLADLLPQVNPGVYPSQVKRTVEVVYNSLAKMTIPGAFLYFAAFVLFLIATRTGVASIRLWALRLFVLAFMVHTAGIGIRWWLVGSIPIKNMFESIMFSSWFGAAVGLALEIWRSRGLFGAAASFVGWMAMVALFTVPLVIRDIGGEIGQVNGVLMSYWLYIHVTTVTASYSLIGMGFALSVWWLIKYYTTIDKHGKLDVHKLSSDSADFDDPIINGGGTAAMSFTQTLARMLFMPVAIAKPQAAVKARAKVEDANTKFLATLDLCNLVVLQLSFWVLGFGIICGAIWADQSWGRPWGWDPKETFALVTWIVYLIVVHMRVATEHKAWWTAVLSVIGFFIMLFNWIGVNFFLVGLHSYA